MKIEAKKDGKGNVIITENSFEMLLACLDNQKFVHEAPQNGDALSLGEEKYKSTQKGIQETIDEYNKDCRKILHQNLSFEVSDDHYLTKRYEFQDELIHWSREEIADFNRIFKNIFVHGKLTDPTNPNHLKSTPLIDRAILGMGETHLTISDGSQINRKWKQEEIEIIKKLF